MKKSKKRKRKATLPTENILLEETRHNDNSDAAPADAADAADVIDASSPLQNGLNSEIHGGIHIG